MQDSPHAPSPHDSAGGYPARHFDGDPSTWAIHIRGLGSTHVGTLRDVEGDSVPIQLRWHAQTTE